MTNIIIGIQVKLREIIKKNIGKNGAIIVVIVNTFFVDLAQKGLAISWVTIAQIVANSLLYLIHVDFRFKLAFKALLAGGVSHIFTVTCLSMYLRYFKNAGKRNEIPFYIDGLMNQIIVAVVFSISIIWIFTNNEETNNSLDSQGKLKDKDFYHG